MYSLYYICQKGTSLRKGELYLFSGKRARCSLISSERELVCAPTALIREKDFWIGGEDVGGGQQNSKLLKGKKRKIPYVVTLFNSLGGCLTCMGGEQIQLNNF